MTRTRILIASLVAAASVAAALAGPLTAAPTCTITWDGGANNPYWSYAQNWSTDVVPGASDHVCIPANAGPTVEANNGGSYQSITATHPVHINSGVSVTATGDNNASTFVDLTLSSNLGGAAKVIVSGTLSWIGGSMSDSGTTVSTGHLNLVPGHYGTVHLQAGRTLRTEGTATWAQGYVYGGAGAVWQQAGTLDAQGETGYWYYADANNIAQLQNTGTITKTAGTGASHIGFGVDNDNSISPATGQIQLSVGTGSTGSFGAADGASIGIVPASSGGQRLELMTGATFKDIEVLGGTLAAPAGQQPSGTDLRLDTGLIAGAGTIKVNGVMHWTSSGRMGENGTTLISSTGSLKLEPGNYNTMYLGQGRTLRNEGGGDWVNGYLAAEDDALWEQAGTFDARGTTGYMYWSDTSGTKPALIRIVPGGKIIRTTAGTSQIDIALDNDGATRVDEGVLEFRKGSAGETSTGDFGGTGGADGGRTSLYDGTFLIGDATFSGVRVDGNAHVSVADGANWNGTNMDVDGGYLEGAGTTTASGTLRWREGGHMAGSGTTQVTGALDFEPGDYGTAYLDRGRTVRAAGTGAWKNGYLAAQDDSVFAVSGTFDARGQTGYWYWNTDADPGAAPKFHVETGGTMTKTAGTGESQINLALEFDGTVTAASGTVGFHGGGAGLSTGALSGGSTTAIGATLRAGDFPIGNAGFAGGRIDGGRAVVADGSTWEGTDLVLENGAIAGPGTTKATGTLFWRGGRMSDGGTTRVTGELRIDAPDYNTLYLDRGRTLRTEGTGSWRAGYLAGGDNAKWENSGTFDARSQTGYAYWNTDPEPGDRPKVVVESGGTITKTTGTGDTYLDWALEFDGLVTAASGTVSWHGGGAGVSTGGLGGTATGHAALKSGTWDVGNAEAAGGWVDGGNLNVVSSAAWTGTDLYLVAGSIGGSGDMTLSGTLHWRGGRMSGSGTTKVTGTLEMDGPDYTTMYLDNGRTLRTEGTGTWHRGYLEAHDNSVWHNTGTFNANSETGYLYWSNDAGEGERPKIVNTGTFSKTAGTGTTHIDAFFDAAGGVAQNTTGHLHLNAGGIIRAGASLLTRMTASTFTALNGATVGGTVDGATITIPDGAVANLSGGMFNNGYLSGDGEAKVVGTYTWAGGYANGRGILRVPAGAKLLVEGGWGMYLYESRLLHNRGTIEWSDGPLSTNDRSAVHNAGTFELKTGDDGWGYNYGVERRPFLNTGTLLKSTGSQTVYMPGTENDGTIRIVQGKLNFDDFLQTSDGRTEVVVAGTAKDTSYGTLGSGYDARLAGVFEVEMAEGYTPASGDAFTLIENSGSNGTFTYEGLNLGNGQTLTADDSSGYNVVFTVTGTKTVAEEKPAEPEATPEPKSAPEVEDVALVAADDTFRFKPGRVLRLLANDTFTDGARVELVGRTRGGVVKVDAATGKLRIRRVARKARVVSLRYRLVAPDGAKSRIARVRIRVRR